MACPVVQPRRGAFTEIVARTGGGLLVKPDDPDALADGLFALLTDRARAATLGARRRRGRPSPLHCGRAWRRGRGRCTAERLAQCMLIASDQSRKHYATPRGPLAILEDVSLSVERGRLGRHHGAVGLRQEHAALHARRARAAVGRHRHDRRHESVRARASAIRRRFAARTIGFVFQDHLLLPQLSALDNVLAPTLVGAGEREPRRAGRSRARAARRRRPRPTASTIGPAELSGGERQRVAIARALVRQPALVLCDEPTGNLDRASAEAVADLLASLQRDSTTMLVVVTHSPALAARFRAPVRTQRPQASPAP